MSKSTYKILLSIFFFLFLELIAPCLLSNSVNAAPGAIPQDMVGDPIPSNGSINTLAQWFTDQTGEVINATYFASWVTQAIGDKLYIGLSAARPGEENGALLASFDGSTISAIGELLEQGMNDLATNGSFLYSTGADPGDTPPPGGHQWDGGNFYVYNTTTATLSKYRCTLSGGVCVSGTYVLPNVIHGFGIYVNASGDIFMATGSDDGSHPGTCVNGVDCFGEIHKSTDNGVTWTRLARFATADPVNPITSYRMYDVIGFNNKMYATYVAEYDQQGFLAESSDNGVTWTNVAAMPSLYNRSRLFVYQNKLFGFGYNRDTLSGLDTGGNVTTYPLGFTAGPGVVTEYNIFAQDSRGNLYTVSSDGKLKATSDLTSWSDYSNLAAVAGSTNFVSVTYWDSRDLMVISGMGTNAKLWTVDVSPPALSQAGPSSCPSKTITAPVLFQPVLTAKSGEVALSWQSVEGATAYNVFYGTQKGSYKFSLVGVKGQGLVSTKIGQLVSGNTYYFVIRATDGCSTSPYSGERSIRVGAASLSGSGDNLVPVFQSTPEGSNGETETGLRPTTEIEGQPASLLTNLWEFFLWLMEKLRDMLNWIR